jgi:hypothetical protein
MQTLELAAHRMLSARLHHAKSNATSAPSMGTDSNLSYSLETDSAAVALALVYNLFTETHEQESS